MVWIVRQERELANQSAGPQLVVQGQTYNTTVLPGSDEHNTYAIRVVLNVTDGFDPERLDVSAELFQEICTQVLANFDEFNAYEIARSDLNHLDINIQSGRQMLMMAEISIFPETSSDDCPNAFAVDPLHTEEPILSTHSSDEVAWAFFKAPGVRLVDRKFVTGSQGRRIEVSYEVLSAFRDRERKYPTGALCIAALATQLKKVNLYVTEIDASSYDRISIKLSSTNRYGGIFTSTVVHGTHEFAIEDGKCKSLTDS
ncbi:MAG: hypothetical protein AAF393_02090 [Pseudomonadota bacterium]